MLKAALDYAERGWPIFPTGSGPDKKAPLVSRGVHEATTDEAQIREWWERWPEAGIGFNAGEAGFMILDLDPGYDWDELERNAGPIPDTGLKAVTPRGGKHLYFRLDDNEITPASTSRLAQHVDVRSFSSYVLLPPSASTHGEYKWEAEGKPAHRTDRMIEVNGAAVARSEDANNWIIDEDLPENVAAAVEWLKTEAGPCVDGQGGDRKLYATAGMLWGYGISPEKQLELMWEHYNPRCIPPWGEDEYDHFAAKVANAEEYHTSPPGKFTKAYRNAKHREMFTAVQDKLSSGRAISAGGFRFVDRDAADDIRPPDWLLDDCLPQGGYGMLFGPPGTFKTFLALDMALSIATGGLGLGEQSLWYGAVRDAGPVLFMAGEGRGQIMNRVRAWEATHNGGRRVQDFILGDPVPRVAEMNSEEIIESFTDTVLSYRKEFALVVYDTVGRSLQGKNENSAEDVSLFTRMIQQIQKPLGEPAGLALHHTGHGKGSQARGSSVFYGDTDVMLRLERKGKERVVKMFMPKQKDAQEWDRPMLALLRDYREGEIDTLVPTKPDAATQATDDGENKSAAVRFEARNQALDAAITKALSDNKTREWTTAALARAVAHDMKITDESTRKLLGRVRNEAGTVATRCFQPVRNIWKWVEEDDDES